MKVKMKSQLSTIAVTNSGFYLLQRERRWCGSYPPESEAWTSGLQLRSRSPQRSGVLLECSDLEKCKRVCTKRKNVWIKCIKPMQTTERLQKIKFPQRPISTGCGVMPKPDKWRWLVGLWRRQKVSDLKLKSSVVVSRSQPWFSNTCLCHSCNRLGASV